MERWKKVGFLWGLFLVALLLVCKDFVFYSTEATNRYGLENMELQGYALENEQLTLLSDGAMVIISPEQTAFNTIHLVLKNTLEKNSELNVYSISDQTGVTKITTKKVSKFDKTPKVFLQEKNYSKIGISINGDIELDHILLENRTVNLVQRSLKWFLRISFLIITSFILAVLCVLSNKQNVKEIDSSVGKSTKKRESNIELLRIICMLFLIGHHCVVHGGIYTTEIMSHKVFSYIFLPIGKLCFVAFVAISMWFNVDLRFKSERFVKMWMQVFTYSVGFAIISFFSGLSMRGTDFFASLFPMIGNSHGFASAYLLFYLIMPFLSVACNNLKKNQARYLLCILFIVQVLSQILGSYINYYQLVYSELTLFVFCYVLAFNLKRWPIKIQSDRIVMGSLFFGIWIFLTQVNCMTIWGRHYKITDFIMGISGTESGLLMIIGGYALFFFAKTIKIKYSPIINKIANFTFAILLIHDHNFLRGVFWSNIIHTDTWKNSPYFIIMFLLYVFAIFYVCAIIDYIRQRLIEDSRSYKKIVLKISKIIEKGSSGIV